MAYEVYSRLQPRRTGPYRVISAGPEYAKFDQDGTRNNLSIKQLTRVAEEERTKMEITSDSRTKTDTNLVQKASIEEEKSSYAMKKLFGHKDQPTGHTILFDVAAMEQRTTRFNRPLTSPSISERHTGED